MADRGITFPGNVGDDCKINKSGTNPGSISGSKGPIKFPGDVGKDPNRAAEPPVKSAKLPKGDIKFAGNV